MASPGLPAPRLRLSLGLSCAEEMAHDVNDVLAVLPAAPRPLSPDQEYDFVQEPPRDYYCAVSLELLLEPHQTRCCGHHLSSGVVERLQRERRPCPMCQTPGFNTHPDLYLRRKVREQAVRCPYRGGGCEWVGDLGNRDAHLRTCPKQPMNCPHCAFTGLCEAFLAHTKTCEQAPILCPNRCAFVQVPRCQLSDHLDRVCPLQPVTCPYNHVGCRVRLSRSEIDVHVQQNEQKHLLLTCSANMDLTRQLNERAIQHEAQIERLKSEVSRMGRELGERVQAVEAGLAAQGEWMESNQQPETGQKEEGGQNGGEERSEEAVKNAVDSAIRGMEERLTHVIRREVEQRVNVIASSDDSRNLVLREMMEQQTLKMETKLDNIVTKVEQNREMTLGSSGRWERALVKMETRQDIAMRGVEERVREMAREIEKSVTEQVKSLQHHVETVLAREMAREGEGRGEEGRGKGVMGEMVKPAVEISQLTQVKPNLTTEPFEMMDMRGGEERGQIRELHEEQRESGAGAKVKHEISPRQHHRHKGTKSSSSHLPKPLAIPKIDFLADDEGIPPVLFRLAGKEDANRKPPTMPLRPNLLSDNFPPPVLSFIPQDSPAQHRPPCEFKIEQFSKLKEQNKEWRSPPFFSHEGYKMCLGLWPNGFRAGAGTYVSVECYKMRDAYSDKLGWNVKLPIHVRIYNYRTKRWERDHVNGDTFVRSKALSDFETSGYVPSHKLIAHNELDDYLLDDNFRIQIYKFEVKRY